MRVAVDRVGGEIEAERLFLLLHALGQRPARGEWQLDRGFRRILAAEQAALPADLGILDAGSSGEQGFGHGEDAGAVGVHAIEGPGPGQPFELALVEQAWIDAVREIIDAGERTVLAALDHQLFHRPLANALQRGERVADGEAIVGLLDREFRLAGVHTRGQASNAHPAHVVAEDCEFIRQVQVVAHRGGEEFVRIMRLQIGGLVGQQGVGRRVAFVETIAGELVDQIEQLVGLAGFDVVRGGTALDESRALVVHLLLDLFAHRTAQQIGTAERIAGEDLRRLHHLFLIDEDPVGLLQDAFEQRVRIFDRFVAILAPPEHRDVVHRAGTIQRVERDDVLEHGRAHGGQRASHALGFDLEHADGVAALDQLERRRVGPFERVEVERDAALREQLDSFFQDR